MSERIMSRLSTPLGVTAWSSGQCQIGREQPAQIVAVGQTQAVGHIALGVQIDQEHFGVHPGQARGQGDRGGGLAHAAFLVQDCDCGRHVFPS